MPGVSQEVTKTDTTASCPSCGGIMRIATVERIPEDEDRMLHRFNCGCGHEATFKFLKG